MKTQFSLQCEFQSLPYRPKNFKYSAPSLRRKLRAHKAWLNEKNIVLSDIAGAPVEIYKMLGLKHCQSLNYHESKQPK